MMKIAVLYTKKKTTDREYPADHRGRSSLTHVMRVKDVLNVLGYQPQLVDINLDSYEYLRGTDFDLAFNLCDDGFRNNALLEAHVPAMLDILDIPYTGSNFFTLATCVNKARTKEILSFHGIGTPPFQVFNSSNEKLSPSLEFPLIVKPLHEDASIGVRKESVVNGPEALKERVDFVTGNYQQPALVERFIIGREVYAGILGTKKDITMLPISEIMFSGLTPKEKICSYEAKWIPESKQYQSTPVQCPAELDAGLEKTIIAMATQAYHLLECHDYGRIDFRIDKNGRPYVLEVNPNPDLSFDAGLARMAAATGLSYEQLIGKVIDSALERSRLKRKAAGLKPKK